MPVLDLDAIRNRIYVYLHANNEGDALIVDDSELARILNDELGDVAMRYGCFVELDTAITLVNGTAVYNLPARHLSTLHVSLDNRPLVASSREELEKRDVGYETTAATVASPTRRFYEDKQGANRIGFHPVPSTASGVGDVVEVLFHREPVALEDDVEAPLFIGDLLEVLATQHAYDKESDLRMPEVAKSLGVLGDVYTMLLKEYWHVAQ